MEIINNLTDINTLLAKFIEQDEYTSIGFVPILNSITASDIITIKKAQKLLDIVIIQNISEHKLDNFSKKTLTQVSPHLVIDFIDSDSKGIHISLNASSINSLNLMKGILAVLPSSVFITPENFEVFKAINTLASNFKDLFSLHNVLTPENLKSFAELEVIKSLQALEKSKVEISKDSISQALDYCQVASFQQLKTDLGVYVNIKVKSELSESILDISYCFKL
ncbi:MAG TPA: hypothetical protein DCL21_00985 [Alphaproteobacteria bacterium]|nr:hypothetical protein [Alphaproteobacteria bacterium]